MKYCNTFIPFYLYFRDWFLLLHSGILNERNRTVMQSTTYFFLFGKQSWLCYLFNLFVVNLKTIFGLFCFIWKQLLFLLFYLKQLLFLLFYLKTIIVFVASVLSASTTADDTVDDTEDYHIKPGYVRSRRVHRRTPNGYALGPVIKVPVPEKGASSILTNDNLLLLVAVSSCLWGFLIILTGLSFWHKV